MAEDHWASSGLAWSFDTDGRVVERPRFTSWINRCWSSKWLPPPPSSFVGLTSPSIFLTHYHIREIAIHCALLLANRVACPLA